MVCELYLNKARKGDLIAHAIEKFLVGSPDMTKFQSQTVALNPRCSFHFLLLSAVGNFTLRKHSPQVALGSSSLYFYQLLNLAEASPAKVPGLRVIGLVWVT